MALLLYPASWSQGPRVAPCSNCSFWTQLSSHCCPLAPSSECSARLNLSLLFSLWQGHIGSPSICPQLLWTIRIKGKPSFTSSHWCPRLKALDGGRGFSKTVRSRRLADKYSTPLYCLWLAAGRISHTSVFSACWVSYLQLAPCALQG